jgi:hypothetical protein
MRDNTEAFRTPVLLLALGIILLLVLLPFGAVRTLHARRLAAADAELLRISDALRSTSAGMSEMISVLSGPGQAPQAKDAAWTTSTVSPLVAHAPFATPDPWGNAYMVNVGAHATLGVVWALSAGPDGIIETPFVQPAGSASVAGDDRAARVR